MREHHDDAGRGQAITCDPSSGEDRVATFRARGERMRELRDELKPLVPLQHDDIQELREMGYNQYQIAEICSVTQPTVYRVLNPGSRQKVKRRSRRAKAKPLRRKAKG